MIITVFDFTQKIPALGEPVSPFLYSYVYKNSLGSTPISPKNIHREKIEITKKAIALAKKKELNKENNVIKQQQAARLSRGIVTKELLAVLHAAIQNQQHYPGNALQNERQGRTTVAFVLLKNGFVRDLRVEKSSGTASLDEAAMDAVLAAQPFKVKDYVTKARGFSIDIVFELS